MGWLDDVTGMTVKDSGTTYPDRKVLRVKGIGVTITDNPSEDTTEVTILPGNFGDFAQTVFTRAGDVVAEQDDYTAVAVAVDPVGNPFENTNLQSALEEQIEGAEQGLERNGYIRPILDVTGDYTINPADWGNTIRVTGTGDSLMTLNPSSDFQVGAIIPIRNDGEGNVGINTPATLYAPEGKDIILPPNSQCELHKVAEGEWNLDGELEEPVPYWQGTFGTGLVMFGSKFPLSETRRRDSPQTPGWQVTSDSVAPDRRGLYRIVGRFHINGSGYDGDPQIQTIELRVTPGGAVGTKLVASLWNNSYDFVDVDWTYYVEDPSATEFSLVWLSDNGLNDVIVPSGYPSHLYIYRIGSTDNNPS